MMEIFSRSKCLAPLARFDFIKPQNLQERDKEHLQYYRSLFHDDLTISQYLGYANLAGFDIACYWFKKSNVKKTVLILHGYNDHVGLYRHCIKVLLSANYNVLAIDLPGHGLSSGEQAAITSFADYRQVVHDLLAKLPADVSESLSLLGQSTGAAIATDYVLHYPKHRFQKVVLLAPLVRPAHWQLIRVQLFLGGAFIQKVKRVFRQNCDNVQFLRFIKYEDPLQPRYVKVSWVKALRDWHQVLANTEPCDIPCLMIQGEADTTVAWRYNLKALKQKLLNTKVVMLPKAKHHLVNEKEVIRQQVFTAMVDFLDS